MGPKLKIEDFSLLQANRTDNIIAVFSNQEQVNSILPSTRIMGFAPASAGTSSSGEWSLGSASAGGKDGGGHSNLHRSIAFTPPINQGGDGRSVSGTATTNVATRSGAILVPSSSSSQANVPRLRPMTGLARRNTMTAAAATAVYSPSSATATATTTMTLPSGSRIIESAGYYQSILQSKITDIMKEIERLQHETEMATVQSKPRMALQKKHDDLLSAVQKMEGNLADCNIAREHLRFGSSPGDIKNSTLRILANNKNKEKEIDDVFYKRKKVEDDIAAVEAELKRRHALVEDAARGENIDLVDEYRTLVHQIEAITEETEQQEDETVLLRHKVKRMMMKSNEGGVDDHDTDSSNHKNEKASMKKKLTEVEEDIELALMTDNEARDHLLGKIDSVELNIMELEDESLKLEGELTTLQEVYKKLLSDKFQGGTVKAYNRLLKKDTSLKRYLDDELPNLKAKLEGERTQLESSIESLRIDILEKERMLEMELPSNEEMELMKEEVAFTGNNLGANKETLALLQQQKKKRMDEVRVHHFMLVISLFHVHTLLSRALVPARAHQYTRRTNQNRNAGN